MKTPSSCAVTPPKVVIEKSKFRSKARQLKFGRHKTTSGSNVSMDRRSAMAENIDQIY
jgi:hypothetical protein